jgi:hypothetical protein
MAGQLHTKFAMKAIDLADLFKAVVGSEPVASSDGPAFAVELTAPDGPSTGGGAQSVQHIRLVREGITLVAGSIDAVERTAELRSYEHLAALHAQRYKGAGLPVTRDAYDGCLKRARAFLGTQNMVIVLKDAAPTPAAAPAKSGGGLGLLFALLLLAGGAVFAYFFFVRH